MFPSHVVWSFRLWPRAPRVLVDQSGKSMMLLLSKSHRDFVKSCDVRPNASATAMPNRTQSHFRPFGTVFASPPKARQNTPESRPNHAWIVKWRDYNIVNNLINNINNSIINNQVINMVNDWALDCQQYC